MMKKIITGEIPLHLFARWDSHNPEFTYLGIGSVLSHKDGVETSEGKVIEMKLFVESGQTILTHAAEGAASAIPSPDAPDHSLPLPTSFVLEKHLEDHICRNWQNTPFGADYEIYDGGRGRQYQTPTGPLDILALRNDGQEYLVLELKRGQAAPDVIGQVAAYMGHIKTKFEKDVRGGIIANDSDSRLNAALTMTPNIDFYRYQMTFSLS